MAEVLYWLLAQEDSGIQWSVPTSVLGVLLLTCAGGGLWFVVRQMWNYSEKVSDAAVRDNMRLRGIIQAQEATIDKLRERLSASEAECGAMEVVLWQNGIRWRDRIPPRQVGGQPDESG
jgi:hypothetical protein